jgi:hypothetical protein
VTIELAAPWNLLCLLALVPLAWVFLTVHRRGRAAAAALRLRRESLWRALTLPLLLAGGVGLVALAAARPTLQMSNARPVRTDAAAYVLVDTSISMLARGRRSDPARIDDGRRVALAVANQLPANVRVGLAVMPQGLLPVLAPTTDRGLLRLVLRQIAKVGRVQAKPPEALAPSAGGAPNLNRAQAPYVATNLTALKTLVAAPFFGRRTTRRVAVLVTDAESSPFRATAVATELARAKVHLLVVRVGSRQDRLWRPIRGRVLLDPGYAPAVASYGQVERLARSFGSGVYGPADAASVASRARRLLGSGPEVGTRRLGREIALGPYLALLALVVVAAPLASILPATAVARARARRLGPNVGPEQPDAANAR